MKEGRVVTFGDALPCVQDGRLNCVDDIARFKTFRHKVWQVEGARPSDIGMIFTCSLGPIRVSRKLKNHESRRLPERMYR